MHHIPPLAAVRVFEAAARHENFSRAGEELGMTQAAVSYQIKLLEERLGGSLFVRRGRGMALTDLGRRISPQLTEAFTTMDRAFASARSESDTILSITAPHTFAVNWLAGRLGEFHNHRPDLAVRLDVSEKMVDLPASEFDVAIRGMPRANPVLTCHFLMRMAVTPLASPAFLERHPLREPADLARVPRLSQNDEWWDLWFQSLAEGGSQFPPTTGLRFESQVLDGHAALAGHGVAILSPPMFQSAIEGGLLVQPFQHLAYHSSSFWLAYAEHKRTLPKVRVFRDWLLDTVKRAVGDDPYKVLEPLA